MIGQELSRRAESLEAARVPFVTALVVRATRPTSVRPGDGALVLNDGTIEGFVGGGCALPAVRLHAWRVLETGEPLLLRIVPGDDNAPADEGAVTVQNPCLSGGAIEIFLEPRLPAPRVVTLGDAPISLALAALGERIGYDVVNTATDFELDSGIAAVVVALQGQGEQEVLERALGAGIPYIGFVASRVRGAAMLESLRRAGIPEDQLAGLHTPAGLDIGARAPEEVALSILAEIIALRCCEGLSTCLPTQVHNGTTAAPLTAVDPICGMTVLVDGASSLAHDGETVYFCCVGCKSKFEAQHQHGAAAR